MSVIKPLPNKDTTPITIKIPTALNLRIIKLKDKCKNHQLSLDYSQEIITHLDRLIKRAEKDINQYKSPKDKPDQPIDKSQTKTSAGNQTKQPQNQKGDSK